MLSTLSTPSRAGRLGDERGAALIIALMAVTLLTALGLALVMLSTTETMITYNYRNAQEALYGADAGLERALQDLITVPDWNDVLTGSTQSAFGGGSTSPTMPDGKTLNLTRATSDLQTETNTQNLWGANNPLWRLYAYGPITGLLPSATVTSPVYVAVWVGDDPSEDDGNPQSDENGVVSVHVEAYGPSGTRKVLEATISRTSGTEIERGQIAQRGQEELNQRARKAAVQTPGKGLTEMRMGTTGGGMVVQ